jgi:hypothetical protein
VKSDVVVVVCAISAGVHGGLAPEHFSHAVATGLGFVAATVVLAALTVVLARDPTSRRGLAAAAVVLAGLLVAYVLAVTTGVPVLQPEPESLELVALVTKAIELVGLVAAVSLLASSRSDTGGAVPHRLPLTVLTVVAVVSAYVALELSTGHSDHGGHSHHAAGPAAGR